MFEGVFPVERIHLYFKDTFVLLETPGATSSQSVIMFCSYVIKRGSIENEASPCTLINAASDFLHVIRRLRSVHLRLRFREHRV